MFVIRWRVETYVNIIIIIKWKFNAGFHIMIYIS